MSANDIQLSDLLSEPPRKRRAAAVAAQKNWQMLATPEDDIEIEDNDLVEITHIIKNTTNTKVAPILNQNMSSGKRSSLLNPTIIDLNRNKIQTFVQSSNGLSPQTMRAKKTFPTPLQTRTQILNVQNLSRAKKQDIIIIETDTNKRVIPRTNNTIYKKPPEVRLTPIEPIDKPVIEGEEEVIVGTYADDLLDEENFFEDTVEDSLILFCENENSLKRREVTEETKDDEIEVIEDKTTQKRIIKPITYSQRQRAQKRSEPITETLEMNVENLDDEFTDGLTFDCEEDILNETQWKQSVERKKDYIQYSKSVLSAKNIKFLPESEVKEDVGIITTTVSETTRIVTKPVVTRQTSISRVISRSRGRPSSSTIQSIRAPIPSIVNQISSQRLSLTPQTISQGLSPTITSNGVPLTLIPVSTPVGVRNPLIISPTFLNPSSGSNLRLILQTPTNVNRTQTYVMIPRSSVVSQNVVLPTMTPTVTTHRNVLPTALQTPNTIRSVPPITTQVVRTPILGVRPSVVSTNPTIRIRNYSNVNQNNSAQTSNSNPLFDCLTIFKGTQNASKKITMKNLLTIKPLPFSWPSNIDALINSLIKLDNALMKEKFKELPIAWMVNAQLIVPPKCKICSKGVCNQMVKTLNTKNELWNCNNPLCKRQSIIDRPRIFSDTKLYDIPVSKLLFLIYYWSIQVDVEDLIKTGQIEMGTEKIYNVWTRLQKVCSLALQTKDQKLGVNVEICSIQIGRFHVLGAMERHTHRAKLAVVPIHEIAQQNGKQTIVFPFIKWLSSGCHIITCEPKFKALSDYGYKVTIQSKNEFLAQNKNLNLTTICGYLIHHLQRFFKDMDLTTLSCDVLTNILDELIWRERFGNNPFTAFYNIIKHISEQCGLRKPDPLINNNTGIRTPTAVVTKTPSVPTPRPIVPELDETNSVFVDEYYYSSLTLKTSVAKTTTPEESPKDSIQCHLCQMFFDNILIVKHLLEHLEKERRGRVRKSDNNEPECKHCLRFFTNRAIHMHEELANSKTIIPFSCRICLIPLLARQAFIGHMKTTHFSGEMPFYCDICNYRSSFQKSLFDHFEDVHSNSSQVMCHFCIRIFDVTKFKNFSAFLYRHLTTHYAVASVYDCDKCCLIFTTKPDLKSHYFKGHNPSNPIDEKFEITPYKVQEQDKVMCTRAKEQELFTPFLPNFENNSEFSSNKNEKERDSETVNFEISCEPNISEYISMEPDIQINLTDENISITNFVLPVDSDFSNDQLNNILTKSFETIQLNKSKESIEGVEPNSNFEAIPEPISNPSVKKCYILSNKQRVVCFECKTHITVDHFKSRMVCEKCNFTSHCKKSFDEHISTVHLKDSEKTCELQNKQNSILCSFPQLVSYKNICKDCDFSTNDGNESALHMIQSNHFDILCKPLDFNEKTD